MRHGYVWSKTDNINHETGEAEQMSADWMYKFIGDYGNIVMSNDTYIRLMIANDKPGEGDIHKERYQSFCDDLGLLFKKEVLDKYPKYPKRHTICVFHIDLTEDNMTAIVSIQDYVDYHFFVKDYKIPLKE